MKKNLVCPECGTEKTKRLIFEWSIKELIGVIVFIVLLAGRRKWGSYSDWSNFDRAEFQVLIVAGAIAFILFPVLLNLRFPRYKCKSCGKKFKPNGEDAENVFEEYE
jgi:rubredoxin